MSIEEITTAVVNKIQKDYWLTPRKIKLDIEDRMTLIEQVTESVCETRGVSLSELRKIGNEQYITYTRYLILLLIRKHSRVNIGTSLLGSYFNRNHSTIDASRKTAENLLITLKEFREDLEKCDVVLINKYKL